MAADAIDRLISAGGENDAGELARVAVIVRRVATGQRLLLNRRWDSTQTGRVALIC